MELICLKIESDVGTIRYMKVVNIDLYHSTLLSILTSSKAFNVKLCQMSNHS